MRLSSRSVFGYGFAIGSVLLATVLESFLPERLIAQQPFLFYYLAFLATVWLAGSRPALLATVLGGLLGVYYYCRPSGTLWLATLADKADLAVYVMMCPTVAALVARLQRSHQNAQQKADELAESQRLLAADIAQRQQTEEALRESERRFRGTFENAAVGVTHTDADGRWITVNETFCDLLGYRREVLLGRDFRELTSPEDLAEDWNRYHALIHGEMDSYSVRKRYVHKDGRVVWMDVTRSVQRDEAGRVLYAISVSQDVTERQAAIEALEQAEDRLRVAQEASNAGIWDWDLAAGTTYLSEQCARLWGLPARSDTVRQDWFELIHPEDREYAQGIFQATLQTGCPLKGEYRVVHPDGRVRWLLTLGKIVERDPAGRPIRLSGITLDVTERKQMESELREAQATAEAATRSKSAFLANVSHELRTPMTSILGMSEVALEEEMPASVRDCLETVKASADTLLALLNDLLDFSRIEAGKVTLETCPFRLRGLVQETLKVLSIRAEEKGLALKSEVAEGTADDLIGDPLRLRQVLTNLVGNAVKFTERGYVCVRVRVEQQTPEGSRLRFEVADTGIGIAPEERERIFAPFTQADVSTTRCYGGTGLGLSITADLVRLMGGRLEVESQPGRGSIFSFLVEFGRPARLAAPCQERRHPDNGLPTVARPLRILLAEDTLANQKLIVRILGKRGHRVEVAGNGREAVDLVSRQEFDVALMDVQMPVMDGLQATRAIRALGECEKNRMPIIALTAHAMKSDQDRCLAAGMDAYLSKPLNSRELVRLVEEMAAARQIGPPAS